MPDIIVPVATWSTPQSPAAADLCTALSVKDALQLLANREQYLWSRAPSLVAVEFTATTPNWVAPAEAQYGLLFGCGGGGGGGGGTDGSTTLDVWAMAGGGGGGAHFSCVPVPLVPGDLYDANIGAGGAGGAISSNGARGDTSSFVKVSSGVALANFEGAGGGAGAATLATSAAIAAFHLGGGPNGDTADLGWGANPRVLFIDTSVAGFGGSSNFSRGVRDGEGGASQARAAGRDGRRNIVGLGAAYLGGVGGTVGGDAGGIRGGGGGGGGGAGPWGAGGAGGAGGVGGHAVLGVRSGSAGVAAAANTGAGGGGGGAGGGHGTTVGVGGAGAAGGSGRMILIYFAKGF